MALRQMRARRTARWAGVTHGKGAVVEASDREAANMPTEDWEDVTPKPAGDAAPAEASAEMSGEAKSSAETPPAGNAGLRKGRAGA